jgi:pyruvate/2-oxoglutarate dehydrogenase complex dihydrolipoamide acyltransferase (E2) component
VAGEQPFVASAFHFPEVRRLRRPGGSALKVKYMMTEIRAPMIANPGAKSSIGRWFKRTGDPVTRGEPLVEMNTDEQTHEVEAPVTGVLATIVLKDGALVEAGAVLGTIREF